MKREVFKERKVKEEAAKEETEEEKEEIWKEETEEEKEEIWKEEAEEEKEEIWKEEAEEAGGETEEEAEEDYSPEEEVKEEFLLKEEDYGSGASGKAILIMILIVLGIFAFSFLGFKYYNWLTAGDVVNIDELHQENLEEELGEGEGYVYNGYSFVYVDGLWWTEMNKFDTLLKVPLHFGPKELEDIPVEGELDLQFNKGEGIYVAIDPNVYDKYYTLAISELSFNIVKGMDRIPVGTCTEENYICDNRSIVSCDNNPLNRPVVELAYEEGPGIELMGTCIKVRGNSGYDIVKSVNRLLYQWYGIMD